MLWLKWFLQELGLKQDGYVVDSDSQSAIDLNKNSMYHARSNHIEVRYHWLRVLVEQQSFELEKIHTDWNPADMLTKVVSRKILKLCARLIDVNSNWRLGLKISSVVGGICWVQSTMWVQPTWLVKAHLWACLQKSSSQPSANHVS